MVPPMNFLREKSRFWTKLGKNHMAPPMNFWKEKSTFWTKLVKIMWYLHPMNFFLREIKILNKFGLFYLTFSLNSSKTIIFDIFFSFISIKWQIWIRFLKTTRDWGHRAPALRPSEDMLGNAKNLFFFVKNRPEKSGLKA